MDAATIAFAGALLVSFTGNMVQLAMKRIGQPEKLVPAAVIDEIRSGPRGESTGTRRIATSEKSC